MLKKLINPRLCWFRSNIIARFGGGSHNHDVVKSHGHQEPEDHHDSHGIHDSHENHDEHGHHDHGHHDIHPYDQKYELRVSPNKKTKTMYYSDPEQMAYQVCSLIAIHDDLKIKEIRLDHTWKQLGFTDLSKMELFIELENEFHISISDDDHEKFKNVFDVVQFLSKSCFIH